MHRRSNASTAPAPTSPPSGAGTGGTSWTRGIDAILTALRPTVRPAGKPASVSTNLTRSRRRMRHAEFRAWVFAGSSGVVGAGCKHAAGTRLERAGMHWTVAGANAVIALRCCKLSGRFEQDHPMLRHRRAQAESWRVLGLRTGGIVGLTRRRPAGKTVATPRTGGEPSRAVSVGCSCPFEDFRERGAAKAAGRASHTSDAHPQRAVPLTHLASVGQKTPLGGWELPGNPPRSWA